MGRSRRTTSNLGGDPRGDTSAPAMSSFLHETSSRTLRNAYEKVKQPKPYSKQRSVQFLLRRSMQISLRHTWFIPLILVLIILAGYFARPSPQNPLHHAIFLSYRLGPDHAGGPNMYGKGLHDITFVAFYTIVLSFTREFIMQQLIQPAAFYLGIKGRAKQARFMEQVYTALYFGVFGPFGLYVMSKGPLGHFNTTAMFEGFPHRKLEAVFKAYYLLQASYWSQQAIVLMLLLEKPRKDFKELVLHHIVTLALIGLSYRFHFTYMGIAVYVTHDISDFFLATSKTLNYLDSAIVGPYYLTFIGIWIYLRHYINLKILWATLTEFRTVGPYELNWETQQYKCWISQIITFALLSCLQALNIFWLCLVIRSAKNYLFNNVRADERSDNEEEDEAEEVDQEENTKVNFEQDAEVLSEKLAVLTNGRAVGLKSSTGGIRAGKEEE